MKQLPIISLFCGAGGLDYGFRQAAFRTILAIDNDASAVKSFNFNAKAKVAVCADLSKMTAQDIVNLVEERAPGVRPIGVIGGPPCQGFSSANVYANPDDPRNRLPFTYAELLGGLNAHYELHFFVFENVPGLKQARHAERFEQIKQAFEKAGFGPSEDRLDALTFGVPQSRPRVFLVGLNKRIYPSKGFPFPLGNAAPRTVREAIEGLPAPSFCARGGLSYTEISHHPNHWTMVPKSDKFKKGTFNKWRSFKQLIWDEPSPTVAYGNREIHIHPGGKRRLSVYEAMLLQGFPQTYRLMGPFCAQVAQVCNAVPPPVAHALARAVRRTVLPLINSMPAQVSEEHAHA